MLYPLKFKPQLMPKIWGSESWKISAIDAFPSEVTHGFLKGNTLPELVEVYMSDLVGELVYEQFETDFPLLVKHIETHEDLSVQVHPDDRLARQRGLPNGKTEMWIILHAEPQAKIHFGFKSGVTKETYLEALKNGTVETLLNSVSVKKNDVFFIPAGLVHAIGQGISLIEIQQSSDTTYRIYDYNRKDSEGNYRPLHVEEALDAIDFSLSPENFHKTVNPEENQTLLLGKCPYFQTQLLEFSRPLEKVYAGIDSFVIYVVLESEFILQTEAEDVVCTAGDAVLLPAMFTEAVLIPRGKARLLEVFIPIVK